MGGKTCGDTTYALVEVVSPVPAILLGCAQHTRNQSAHGGRSFPTFPFSNSPPGILKSQCCGSGDQHGALWDCSPEAWEGTAVRRGNQEKSPPPCDDAKWKLYLQNFPTSREWRYPQPLMQYLKKMLKVHVWKSSKNGSQSLPFNTSVSEVWIRRCCWRRCTS